MSWLLWILGGLILLYWFYAGVMQGTYRPTLLRSWGFFIVPALAIALIILGLAV